SDKGQSLDSGNETTPNNAPKLIPVKEHEDKVAAVGAEWGRKYKAIEEENNTLKSQLATNQTLIKEAQDEIAKAKSLAETLSKDDPDKKKLLQLVADSEKELKDLKAQRTALETEKVQWDEDVKNAREFKLSQTVSKIAGEYEGGDEAKLKSLTGIANATTEEAIRKIADTLWTKKAQQNEQQNIKPDPGTTNGGGVDTSKMSARELIVHGLKKKT
ncbi:MAG: hypothetical protein PHQ43_08320, partial [Dehalococcoidales bacterium]|nr:hypothetical protein [Dehalococcoidales bacterium]